MFIYYLVFLITLLIQLLPANTNRQYLRRAAITFIPVFFIGALRAEWADYNAYLIEFEMAHRWIHDIQNASEHSETGYMIINSIIPTWRLFLIITSAFTCLGFVWVMYKCVPPRMSWLMVVLFFLASDKTIFFMYSGIRNAIAIAIMCLSIMFITNKKWIPYFALTALATTIHTSAILFMPVAFLLGRNVKMTKRESWIWIGTMLVFQVISMNVLFEQATLFASSFIDRYSEMVEHAEELGDTRTLLMRFVTAVFVCTIVWFMRETELTKTENAVGRIALIYSMAPLLGSLHGRLAQCYILFFISTVCFMMLKWKRKEVKILFCGFVIMYLWFGLFKVFMRSELIDLFIPYKSILSV